MKHIGYARVSSTGQSLDSQLEQLNHCDIIFQEKVSAATLARPELDRLMQYARKDDVVVVTKLDRLARSTKDLLEIVEDLDKRQVSLKIMNINLDTSSPTGKLMLTMLGAIAEFERGLMLERQAEGIARAKDQGKYKGRTPKLRALLPKVNELKAQGRRLVDIATMLGVSPATLYRMQKLPEAVNVG
jgi:DNA invertase Pin-like site-specific DNA recombinase